MLHIWRRKGGTGLLKIEAMYKAEIVIFVKYLKAKYKKRSIYKYWKPRKHSNKLNLIIKIVANLVEELNQWNQNNKSITNRYQVQTISKIGKDNRRHHISIPNIGKRTTLKETWKSVCSSTLYHTCESTGTIRLGVLVWASIKSSIKHSWR
jgi:hypothetical protein